MMNWGTGLTWAIIAFVMLMATLVVYSFRQELNMVTDNYYEKDLEYDLQMTKVRNTKLLAQKPVFAYRPDDDILSLHFPQYLLQSGIAGQITLFRPSDHKMDKTFKLDLDEKGFQFIKVAALAKGEWMVKLNWKSGQSEYYDETNIFIR